jgi:two-component system cell cycle response regulator
VNDDAVSDGKHDGERTQAFKATALRAVEVKQAFLIVVSGNDLGLQLHLQSEKNRIGRSEEAEIYLNDTLISRTHACVTKERIEGSDHFEYFLTDAGSTNGSFVNGQRVCRTMLRDGDKIQVGETVLKFSYLDEVDFLYQKKIYDLINYDDLTGLLTLRFFYQELEKELGRAQRFQKPLSILMMDLDYFKLVNDTHGHQVGSFVLKIIGRKIRETLRIQDVSGRFGGEEFISYLPKTDKKQGRICAERLRRSIAKVEFRSGEQSFRITMSIGISTFPDDGEVIETLVKKADTALYRAKEEGRNRVCLYDGGPSDTLSY